MTTLYQSLNKQSIASKRRIQFSELTTLQPTSNVRLCREEWALNRLTALGKTCLTTSGSSHAFNPHSASASRFSALKLEPHSACIGATPFHPLHLVHPCPSLPRLSDGCPYLQLVLQAPNYSDHSTRERALAPPHTQPWPILVSGFLSSFNFAIWERLVLFRCYSGGPPSSAPLTSCPLPFFGLATQPRWNWS